MKEEGLSRRILYTLFFLNIFVATGVSISWFSSLYPLEWMNVKDPLLSFFVLLAMWFLFSVLFSSVTLLWLPLLSLFSTNSFVLTSFIGSALFVCVEYVRAYLLSLALYGVGSFFGPHHTYYSLGYLASSVPFLRDIVAVGGIYAATFCFVVTNYAFLALYLKIRKVVSVKTVVLLFSAPFLLIIFSYVVMFFVREKSALSTGSVFTVVNTKLPSSFSVDLDKKKIGKVFNYFSRNNMKEDEVIVFPENISVIHGFRDNQNVIPSRLQNAELIIGSYSSKSEHQLFFFQPENLKGAFYDKQILMPISEYLPYWVSFISKLLFTLQITSSTLPDKFPHVKTGTFIFKHQNNETSIFGSICSENISPYLYRDAVRHGATVFVNVASHAPFKGSELLMRQTEAINTLRAIENGRYYVVASNYGKSYIFDDFGRKKELNSSLDVDSFSDFVPNKHYITPYVRFKDYVVVLAFVFLVVVMLWGSKNKLS